MKKIITLCIAAGLWCCCLAQEGWPPPFDVKIDSMSAYWQELPMDRWQQLADAKGDLNIETVSAPTFSNRFRRRVTNSDAKIFWSRYRLRNAMNSIAHISLNSNAPYDDFYVQDSTGQWRHIVLGTALPWKKRDGLSRVNCAPVHLRPGATITVYQRTRFLKPGLPDDFQVVILDTRQVVEDNYVSFLEANSPVYVWQELLEAFMIGFMLMAVMYALSFYRIVKEKEYLYFALMLTFLTINRFYNIVADILTVKAPLYAGLESYLGFAWMFILIFEIQFFRHFFKIRNRYYYLDRILVILIWLIIPLNIFSLLRHFGIIPRLSFLSFFYSVLFKVVPGVMLLTACLFLRKADRLGRLVLIGAFPMLFLYGVIGWFSPENRNPNLMLWPAFSRWLGINFRLIEAPSVLWFVLMISLILFIRYNAMRKLSVQQALDNERLAKEKEIEKSELIARQKKELEVQVDERTAELKRSLQDLQLTQAQLIQSEKMASLGELTAGIAHEIQNPLNFVNNFSELNTELIGEMQEEINRKNFEEARLISNDIAANEQKIVLHGKRAEAIVRGMLQHSRAGSGQKEPTDLNALVEEYLRLAYHGLRAKDKSFNATMSFTGDPAVGTVPAVPQDLGRVFLNLFNNAFYAAVRKQHSIDGGNGPFVHVSTLKTGDRVEVIVEDNGDGVPAGIVDKIFQPFFTTKPTGQGTGLGLSLSYEICKAHGGDLRMETTAGNGSRFIVQLPVR